MHGSFLVLCLVVSFCFFIFFFFSSRRRHTRSLCEEFRRVLFRSYEVLADKVQQFNQDAEVRQLLAEIKRWDAPSESDERPGTSPGPIFAYERLDHLVFEILTGTRRA